MPLPSREKRTYPYRPPFELKRLANFARIRRHQRQFSLVTSGVVDGCKCNCAAVRRNIEGRPDRQVGHFLRGPAVNRHSHDLLRDCPST